MMVNQVCICADRLSISLTLFSYSDFLQPLPLMSVLTAGLRGSTTIIIHSCGLSHQSPIRRSALSFYPCQCWGWCTVSQEQHLSLKISGACSIQRSVLFCFLFLRSPFHPNDADRLCSVDWTDFNDYAAVGPVGYGLLGYDSELCPAPPGFPEAHHS